MAGHLCDHTYMRGFSKRRNIVVAGIIICDFHLCQEFLVSFSGLLASKFRAEESPQIIFTLPVLSKLGTLAWGGLCSTIIFFLLSVFYCINFCLRPQVVRRHNCVI